MMIAIQQPEHLPWLGFFNKMMLVDEFIYLDNVQFKKRYFENRNKIKTQSGWDWLNVPVKTKGLYTQKINEVEIDNSQSWQRKYLNKIRSHYSKSDFFEEVFNPLQEIVKQDYEKLVALNISLINFIREYLEIITPAIFASDVAKSKGSDLILQICLKRGAKTYLSGPDGRNYLQLDEFKKNNIEVIYHDYRHPEYKQTSSGFLSYMSVIDLIFNYGNKSRDIIRLGN